VARGDRIAIYMPMVLELPIAHARMHADRPAAHSIIFGGFSPTRSSTASTTREAKVVITADGGYRRGCSRPLKPAVDEAVASTPSVEHVVVIQRGHNDVTIGRRPWTTGTTSSWPARSDDCPPEHMNSEDLLYLLYTSGIEPRTGNGTCAWGYLTQCVADALASGSIQRCRAGRAGLRCFMCSGGQSIRRAGHELVVPVVTAFDHRHVVVAALDDDDVLDGKASTPRLRRRRALSGATATATVSAIGWVMTTLASRVVDAVDDQSGEKPPKMIEWAAPIRVHASMGDGQLEHHRHVDRDPIPARARRDP